MSGLHDTESLAIAGTLDALRESLNELFEFVRRRVTSRGGVVTHVPAAVRKVELLAANRFRHMATVYNDSTAVLFLALGSNAATDEWSVKLNPDDYYETPAGYTGPLTGVWAAANGQARISELI